MGVSPDYPLAPPSTSDLTQDHSMNISMLYYSFFVVATAGVLLAVYHCLIVNCCKGSSWERSADNAVNVSVSVQNFECRKVVQLESTTFEYRNACGDGGGVAECVVCLSAYEDGEEIRRLLRCNHCFHAPCIDMWLFSHFECPLCRAPVGDIKGIIYHSGNSTSGLTNPIDLV
ncbi:hypothetical protein RND81_06G183400 [Saponaria officinalis]|uniref:RING-type domain-containing protein n=1 Tax=Saponaria officinalis TaxID=3572 RepID=A0AAW1KED2_SAPOF